ncbi:MAG: tetratricopeptide repeat protein, partial [Planctomycetota bacterium]
GALLIGAAALTGCQSDTEASSEPSYQRITEAEREFIEGAKSPPTSRTLHAMARLLVVQGRTEEAAFIWQRILRDDPGYLPAHSELGNVYLRDGKLDEAIAILDAGHELSVADPVLINNLGVCWLLKDEYGKAYNYFTQAHDVAPTEARYQANRAVALSLMGEYDQALEFFNEVMSAGEAHYNVAVLAESRDDSARAEAEFRMAREMGFKPAD